ncbi:MAG: cell division protein ZapE [Pseudomonadota bacterium]
MSETPLNRYRALVAAGTLRPDDAQRAAVEKLNLLHMRLTRKGGDGARGGVFGLFGFGRRGEEEVEERLGLYLYGGVGRGKSMLMDLFFADAPVAKKTRIHFHAFMQRVHRDLDAARKTQVEDPIKPVARRIADETRLLCFDEFQVSDIADAMILGRLFKKLFERGVVVVATSNRHPSELYKDGLNRQLFLPFIDLLMAKLDVHQLEGPTDFRIARARGMKTYHSPLGAEAAADFEAAWDEVVASGRPRPLVVAVQGREVRLPTACGRVARAGFEDLCGKPLGPADYLAIAEAVDTLFLEAIPTLSRARNNEAKRFVTLIDALYEARRQLICTAAAEPSELYVEGEGAFEFARTASRLEEMRSADWPPAA